MPTYATADQIINAAAQELGLPPVSLSSAANDATGFQMLGLLNALGDELVRMKDWQFLEQIMEFTGDGTTTTFPLPDDYGRQINQTQWATKDNRPMRGPDSASVWSWSQYGIVSVGVYYRYRIISTPLACAVCAWRGRLAAGPAHSARGRRRRKSPLAARRAAARALGVPAASEAPTGP